MYGRTKGTSAAKNMPPKSHPGKFCSGIREVGKMCISTIDGVADSRRLLART